MADTGALNEQIIVTVDDRASASMAAIGRSMETVGAISQSVTKTLQGWTAGTIKSTAAQLGLGLGLKQLIDQSYAANKELGTTQKRLAGVQFAFEEWDKSLSSSDRMKVALAESKELTKQLEELEEKYATDLPGIASAYEGIAGPGFKKLHLSQEQVIALTDQATAASKVFGVSAEQAGLTLTRVLETKTVRGFDTFAVKLRETLGPNLKKLKPEQIFQKMQAAMQDLGPAAELMSKGIGGTMFRLRDFIDDILRDLGGPAFKYIGTVIEGWRQKLAAVTSEGKTIADVYGEKIKSGLEWVVNLSEKIAAHWREIALILGSAVVGSKLSEYGALLGKFAGAKGAAMGTDGIIGGALKTLAPQLTEFSAVLGPAVAGLGAFAAAVEYIAGELQAYHFKQVEAASNAPATFESLKRGLIAARDMAETGSAQSQARIRQMYTEFGVKPGEGLPQEKIAASLRALPEDKQLELIKAVKPGSKSVTSATMDEATGMMVRMFDSLSAGLVKASEKAVTDPHKTDKSKIQQTFTGDIHITQDFKDQDPDRVFVTFKNDLERLAENTTSSPGALAFG